MTPASAQPPQPQRRARVLAWASVWLWAWALPVLLGGCASVWRVDSEVQAHAAWQAAQTQVAQPGDTYRLDDTPAQRAQAAGPADAARAALHRALQGVGLVPAPDGAVAHWSVQWQVRSERVANPYGVDDGVFGPRPGRDNVVTGQGAVVWLPRLDWPAPPWRRREAQLWMRPDGQTRVAFETRAVHEGPWTGDAALWPALWQAALSGFPQPQAGPRTVWVELPR